MTGQEFENHMIFEKLDQFKNRIIDNEVRESIGIDGINFFETAYNYFLDRLRLTIPIIVQETEQRLYPILQHMQHENHQNTEDLKY